MKCCKGVKYNKSSEWAVLVRERPAADTHTDRWAVCLDEKGIGDYGGSQEESREGILSVNKLKAGSSLRRASPPRLCVRAGMCVRFCELGGNHLKVAP